MFFKRHVALTQEYLGFLLLNVFDLFMTGYIFRYQGIEANKVADWVLSHYNYQGFAIYKFLLVTVVILACEGIATKSLRKAKIVVLFGCLILTFVVCYEGFLIITGIHMRQPEPTREKNITIYVPTTGEGVGSRLPDYVMKQHRNPRGVNVTPPLAANPTIAPSVPNEKPKVGGNTGGKAGQ